MAVALAGAMAAMVPGVASASAAPAHRLGAARPAAGDHFGASVAISGSTAVVGAFNKNSATGAAYVFARSGTAWSQQAELTAADGAPGDNFGNAIAISGSTAVIGAPGENSYTGAAYVFTRSGTIWSQQAKLTASDAAQYGHFGWSVAISGSTAIVGAPWNPAVAAYVFANV